MLFTYSGTYLPIHVLTYLPICLDKTNRQIDKNQIKAKQKQSESKSKTKQSKKPSFLHFYLLSQYLPIYPFEFSSFFFCLYRKKDKKLPLCMYVCMYVE